MDCPRCGHAQVFDGPECERCGVIFARLRPPLAAAEPGPGEAMAGPACPALGAGEGDAPIARGGWIAFAAGAGLALLTQVVPFLEMLVGYFVVLVHELGHALAGWVFGYPSLPAFDFTYGGGVTTHLQRSGALVLLVSAAFGFLLWLFRRNRRSLALVAGAAAVYAILQLTPGHEALIVAMGHGGELVFAALFLHRALSGRGCKLEAERPLYAWIGFHIVFHDLRFAWGLATSALQRELYAEAKGGGHWMDFSRLSREFLGVPLEAVAAAFLLLCLLAPAASVLANLQRARLAALAQRLARVE